MQILWSWAAIGQHASNSDISVDQNGRLIIRREEAEPLLELALDQVLKNEWVRIGDVVVP